MTVKDSGAVVGAVIAEGIYKLSSPAHFGGGETDDTDMAILRHASGMPFIPGASIAGAGRAALNARTRGWKAYRADPNNEQTIIQYLFGGKKADLQSALIVDDAELQDENSVVTSVRDGVAIDPKQGTAREKHKYDMEVLPPGACFRLRLELLIRQGHPHDLRPAFYSLLDELASKSWPLRLGARTHRGYGLGRVAQWKAREANFSLPEDAAWWLLTDRVPTANLKLENLQLLPELRRWVRIEGQFQIQSSLLVRAYPQSASEPDMVPVRSGRNLPDGLPEAAVPGTAIAGACRHRALRIARTLAQTKQQEAQKLVADLFGPDPDHIKQMQRGLHSRGNRPQVDSRVTFDESLVKEGTEEIQSRIHIDPFTGGVHEGPFEEQAIWSGNTPATLSIDVRVQEPEDAEVGLLLCVLKDLWLEDLPLGGGSSIGRGILRGQQADITIQGPGTTQSYSLKRTSERADISGLTPNQAQELNNYAQKLADKFK